MANSDRERRRCPYVRPQFVTGSAGKEMQHATALGGGVDYLRRRHI